MSGAHPILKRLCRGALFFGLLAGTAHADVAVAYWKTGGTGVVQVAAKQTPAARQSDRDPRDGRPRTPRPDAQRRLRQPQRGSRPRRTVRVSIASVSKAPGAAAGTCDSSDFTLAHRAIKVGADVPSGRRDGCLDRRHDRVQRQAGRRSEPLHGRNREARLHDLLLSRVCLRGRGRRDWAGATAWSTAVSIQARVLRRDHAPSGPRRRPPRGRSARCSPCSGRAATARCRR